MIDYYFDLKDFMFYLYFFPLFMFVVLIVFKIKKRDISDKTIPFYGKYIGLSNKNIISLTLLFLYYYLIIVSIFVNNFSILHLIIFLIPIVLFNIINFYFIRLFIDILNTFILYVLLYSKVIFYNYMIDVGEYWYVILLYGLLCLFIFAYVSFLFFRRFRMIIKQSKYISKKVN